LSLPSYDEFRQALTDPARRAQIGLVIADSDAQSLAGNEEWARNYFDSWIAMAAPAPTEVLPAAPATPSPFSSAPTESFSAPSAPSSAAPAAPFGQPAGQPGGYAPAGYQAAPQQGYAAAPQQQGQQPFGGGQGGYQNMPQGQMPKKKGLPGWAIGVIIGGAALVLLGGVGVAALVIGAVNSDDDRNNASSSETTDGETSAPDDADSTEDPFDSDDTLPDDSTGGSDFGLDYSQADADAYTAIAGPAYGLEASEYMDQEFIDETLITAGESVCLSLSTGYSESELVESLDTVGLEPGAGQTIVDAAKKYLCD